MGAFKTAAVTCNSATANKLNTFPDDSRSDFDLIVYNNGANTVYVGGSDVSTAIGIPVAAGNSISVRVEADVYGITASGTSECRVGSMGVQ